MRGSFGRIVVAILPLASVPLAVHAVAAGHLDFGAGEKDLVWILPWAVWSLLFAIHSLVLWRAGRPPWRSAIWAAAVGLIGVLIGALLLSAFGGLGLASAGAFSGRSPAGREPLAPCPRTA